MRKYVEYFSPGRINIIGEHLDYVNGFSIPSSIDKGNYISICAIDAENKIILKSDISKYKIEERFSYIYKLDTAQIQEMKSWKKFVFAILHSLKENGIIINQSFELNIKSTLPSSAGMSSSASVSTGIINCFNYFFDLKLNKDMIIEIAKRAENKYIGAPCGYLDQISIVKGKSDKLMLIDFDDLSVDYFPFSKGYSFIIVDSSIKHSNASGGYVERVHEKDKIDDILKEKGFDIRKISLLIYNKYRYDLDNLNLNDISATELWFKQVLRDEITDFEINKVLLKRLIHYITEIYRTIRMKDYFNNGEFDKGYKLLDQSHISLSNYYEVSIDEIDYIVDRIQANSKIISARIMGGGFGGSIISVVKEDDIDECLVDISKVLSETNKRYSIKSKYIVVKAGEGYLV